jgi:fermentation-respiration switch protein FrsA (DUF1100 family)
MSALARFEQAHVFQAARYPAGDWTLAGSDFEDAWFTAADGTRLNGWYLPHENPAGTVLFAHGNAGNLTQYVDLMRNLHDRHRLSVMVFDYRGYGKSDGEPDEDGILEDACAAREWLAQRANLAENDIILMGQSLGGGIVVDLAADDGARGLVLLSTFTSLPDVAAHHFPLLPTRQLMHNRLDSIAKIGRYHGPLLQVHGDKDRVIPISQGKRLFAAANEPKRFIVNSGGDHNDALPEQYHKALDEFLVSLPAEHPQPAPQRWRRTQTGVRNAGSSSSSG